MPHQYSGNGKRVRVRAKIEDVKNGRRRKLKALIIDVRKAHLNAICHDDVYVQIPMESKQWRPGKCGKLKRWLYGMRPAAQGLQN